MTDSGYRYIHLDVFTDTLFGGKQLAVFLEPEGLADETLQSIEIGERSRACASEAGRSRSERGRFSARTASARKTSYLIASR